jgi:hypothetical protein
VNESLIKYLAGLLDADGSLSFSFKEDKVNRPGQHFISLALRLASSSAVDTKGFIPSLTDLTQMGYISVYKEKFVTWVVSKRADIEMLLPRVIKHMVIKAQHWQWLLETWRNLRADGATVSDDQRNALALASKESRRTRVGPLKPKNHPTWAWLAGYLDGDGWYSYRRHRNGPGMSWHLRVGAVAHVNDVSVLEFIQRSFGGIIADHNPDGSNKVWNRSIGHRNRSFALSFLPNLAKHSRLKRHKIDAIIHHHQQRLSVPGTKRTFCQVDNCGLPSHGHGMCKLHYVRDYRRCKRQSEPLPIGV